MIAAIFLSFALLSFGQEPDSQGRRQLSAQQPTPSPQVTASPSASPGAQPSAQQGPQRRPQEQPSPTPEEVPVVTHHEIRAGGRTLRYTATAGMMPIKNRDGETEARIFFMAYTLDGEGNRSRRPLTFSFNGGPGSASVWLHLGAIGPKRVRMNPDGTMPAPPYELVDNEYTWLNQTDLVFVDPVGTGYSRAVRPELAARFFGLNGDIESVGEFIRMYLTRYERWTSPLFLAGESYGTTRASALSGYLASTDYMLALDKGDRMPAQERQDVINRLSRYTGLAPQFVDNANLRVSLNLFRKELLRGERRSIGRLDARFKGFDSSFATDSPDFDASEAAIRPPYTSTFNNYVRSELGYKTDAEYYILGGGITSPWNWNTNNGYVDTSVALRNALARNPYLKIFVAMGYYDMATPYYAVQYTLHHISLDPVLLRNFSTGYYEAGHMMYIDEKSLGKLRADVGQFIEQSQHR